DDDSCIRLFPSRPFQVAFEFTEVIMRKNANAGAAQTCAIDQRGMNEFIENDDVVFPGDGGKSADRGRVTAIKSNCGWHVFPFCNRALQCHMRRLCSRNQTGCAGADAKLFNRVCRRGTQLFVGGETEVIVGRKVNEMLADQLYARPLGRSNFAQSPQKRTRTEPIELVAKWLIHRESVPLSQSFTSTTAAELRGAQATSLRLWAGGARRPESEPKAPGKQRSGVGPDPGFGIAQDHYDDVAARARTACNQTVAGRFGVASFHSVAKGKPLQNFVGVFQFAGPTVGVAKNKLRQTDNGTNRRIRITRARDNREIACGAILAGNREPVRVQKMRMSRAEKLCFCIHSVGERFDAAGVVARQTTRYIVGTFHQECAQQINPLINFPRSNVQPHWLCESVDRFYSNRSIEVTGFRNNQRGQQFLCARGRPRLIGIFLM